MKALVYRGPRDVRFEQVDDPVLSAPTSAIVAIEAASICGSDLHPYHEQAPMTDYVIGHEAVGRVTAVGAEVEGVEVGDRVLITASISCGVCGACREGRSMQCESYLYPRVFGLGFPGIGGCQAEAVEVPDATYNVLRLPEQVSVEVGLLLTDTMATGWAAAKGGRVRTGSDVAVFGLGAVGVQAVAAALAMGAARVFAIDPVEERRRLAEEFGAIALAPEGAAGRILEATNGRGVDAVLDSTGLTATLNSGFEIAAKGGVISLVGIPEGQVTPLPLVAGIGKNLSIALVSCSVQEHIPALLSALEDGRLDATKHAALLTHRMPLEEGAEAYALFDSRTAGVQKVLLTV